MTETPQSALDPQDDCSFPANAAAPVALPVYEISLIDLMIDLAERKRFIAYVTAAFAIFATLLSLLLPVRYTATVTLLTPQQNTSISAALASPSGPMSGITALTSGGLGLRNPNDMFVGMLMSRTVEDAMIERYGLMAEYRKKRLSDARKKFEKYAIVEGGSKDGQIRISIEDGDPRRAAELANGYVDQFRALSRHLAITEASQRRLFFEQELAQAKENLANAEEAMKETEHNSGLIELSSQTRALIESAATLRAQITAREVQIQGMQTYATGENAQLVQAQRELEGLRAQLARMGGSEESSGGGMIVPGGKVPEASLDYIRKLRDVKYNETIFEILARQFEIAKLDEAKQGTLIQVVDPAIPPDKHSSPQRGLIIIGVTILGFFCAVFTVFLQIFVRFLMRDPEANAKLHHLRAALCLRGTRTS